MLTWNLTLAVLGYYFLSITVAQNAEISGRVSIIDVLSASAQFSILIKHLQRTGLVPVLNEATNVTFIAPTNAAFVDIDSASISRELLLYHLLNETIILQHHKSDLVAPTYLFSSNLDYSTKSGRTDDYPLPVYMKYLGKQSFTVENVTIVEQDLKASTGHGVVQVVDKLLAIPNSVCESLSQNNETTIFSKLFRMEFNCSMPILPSYATLLVPLDSAFDQLNEIELNYLFTRPAKKDRRALLSRHIINSFITTPLIDDSANATALDGTTLTFSNTLLVNDSYEPTEKNILASDGVLHYYDKFISGSEGNIHSLIDFTPEKYCISLGAHGFLKELNFRGLIDLVRGDTDPQTLFVPLDDQDDMFTIQSTTSLLYHFATGKHNLDFENVLNSNILLKSKSTHKALGGDFQRIKVGAAERTHTIYLNGREKILQGPYEVGNTTLFTIDGPLDLPTSLDVAIGSVYHSSQSASYLSDLGMLDLPSGKHGWTVLLPTNAAWAKLDLVQKYLESNESALKGVFESLMFAHPFYSDSPPVDTHLMNGDRVSVSIRGNEHLEDHFTPAQPLSLFVNETEFKIQSPNILSSSGVAHSVSHVVIPDHVDIVPNDILKAVDTTRFVKLLNARNLSHVLDPDSSYTILAPSDRALEASNITIDTPEIDVLLRLHILPGNPIDKFLNDGDDVESLEKGIHLSAKELNSGLYLVSIVEGDMREIRVLNRGDSCKKGDNVTTILYVDRFLSPDWITRITPPFRHPFRLKTPVAILLGMVCGAILIFSVLSCALFVFLKRNSSSSKQNSGSTTPGISRTGSPDLERRPLLSHKSSNFSSRGGYEDAVAEGDSNEPSNGYGTASRSRRSSARSARSMTSEHSVSEPIATVRVQKDREHGRHLALPRV